MLGEHNDSRDEGMNSRLAWYAVYTRHQHEKAIASALECKGFEILLPLYTSARRWKDRTKLLSLPLFPCYVFINGGLDRMLDIVTTPGIFSVVSSAGQPIGIPSAEIMGIRSALESGAHVEPHPFLECGERVRVTDGAMTGVEGILLRKKNICRLVLSVEMLGKSVAVEVDSYQVEQIERRRTGGASMSYEKASHWDQMGSSARN
jgi:transcription antitermination factor NusG